MVWWVMAVQAAETALAAGQSKSETSMTVFSIPDETDDEFADYMFSRKTDALVDTSAAGG